MIVELHLSASGTSLEDEVEWRLRHSAEPAEAGAHDDLADARLSGLGAQR